MLTSTDAVYFESGLELTRQLRAAAIEVLKPPVFKPGSFTPSTLDDIRHA